VTFRALALAALLLLAGCHRDLSPQDVDVRGLLPPLSLSMTDVTTGKMVTAADFSGQVTLLYFGYTNCPDVCPATLYNVDKILRQLGKVAGKVDFLFVTVDPDRDTPPILSQYVALFGPQITGLRGTPNQLFSLARRYRAVFSVTKPTAATPYAVTHSAAVYVFDGNGQAQFLIAGLDTDAPDISGIAADLRGVIGNPAGISVVDWLQNLITSG